MIIDGSVNLLTDPSSNAKCEVKNQNRRARSRKNRKNTKERWGKTGLYEQ